MAGKGWSFGALTDALKSAAFLDTGTAIGNVMTVGTFNIGRDLPSAIANVDFSTLSMKTGEVMMAALGTATNVPTGMVFAGSIRVLCLASGANPSFLFDDTAGNSCLALRNSSGAWTSVRQLVSENALNGQVDLLGDTASLNSNAAKNSTFYFNSADAPTTRRAYLQYVNANTAADSNELRLSAGGSGYMTLFGNGRISTPNSITSGAGVSSLWAAMSGALHVSISPFSRITASNQGMFLGWNEDGTGRGAIIVNKGGGVGGLNFRFVNANNSAQDGSVLFDGSGQITSSGVNFFLGSSGNQHKFQRDGNIVETSGSGSIFRSIEGSTSLNDAMGFFARWTRTGARRDFGIISRDTDKWLDAGWVVIGAAARGNENIQNLVLLGGRIQIYRANGGWVDSAA